MLVLILNSNRVISALINKNSIIRDFLLSDRLQFYCPEYTLEEIEKYKATILEKSNLTEMEFYFTLSYILQRVEIVSKGGFASKLPEAESIMKTIDPKDAPFVALSLSVSNQGIFSNDPHFDQAGLKRWSVEDIMKWLEEN